MEEIGVRKCQDDQERDGDEPKYRRDGTLKAMEAVADIVPHDRAIETLSLSEKFLAQEEERFRGPEKPAWQGSAASETTSPVLRAREDLVHALLNHNDFVTIR